MSARVLLTGSLGGIGVATTEALRERDARVVGLDLSPAGDDAGTLACDVRDQASVDAAVATAVERLGGLDALVNNAGLGNPQSAGAAPDEDAVAVLDVNLLGPWRVTSAALPALRESHGRVINVASGLAHLTIPFAGAYCASKRGLVAYSDALRLEFGDEIDVTTVYPGYIRTPIHDSSGAVGVGLEGAMPADDVSTAANAIARAALGPPLRDLATTRRGTVAYAIADRLPRRLLERLTRAHLRRLARRGHFAEDGLAGELAARIRGAQR